MLRITELMVWNSHRHCRVRSINHHCSYQVRYGQTYYLGTLKSVEADAHQATFYSADQLTRQTENLLTSLIFFLKHKGSPGNYLKLEVKEIILSVWFVKNVTPLLSTFRSYNDQYNWQTFINKSFFFFFSRNPQQVRKWCNTDHRYPKQNPWTIGRYF